ncbi:MAG: DEAD/DEAH box helicase [Oscillospiraceae bacterium]|nr:DEAD/DEAH box helicase [Oscillospiraceae bacterium]
MAAAFLLWEEQHGPWEVWEDEYEYRRRKEKESIAAQRRSRVEDAKRIGLDPVPVMEAFPGRGDSGPVLFDMEKALSSYTTTPYAIYRMKQIANDKARFANELVLETARDGSKRIRFKQYFDDDVEAALVWGLMEQTSLTVHESSRQKEGRYSIGFYQEEDDRTPDEPLDEYALVSISRVWDRAEQESRAKVTDDRAMSFFRRIQKAREEESRKEVRSVEVPPQKKETVELLPRIVVENGEPMLSFKIGSCGNRKYILKDCYQLIDAVQKEKEYVLGKKDVLNFKDQDFVSSDRRLYEFIQRHRSQSYAGTYQLPLTGTRLDTFYDMYEGGKCELLDKTNKIKDELVTVGHIDIRFVLTADRLTDARGSFMGIVVSGFVPVLISGNSSRYVLNTSGLSRISKAEKHVLDPFLEVADSSGYFRFQVGTEHFREFYYRIIPGLLENPFVEFVDNCRDEATPFLPPEAQFSFWLDLEDNLLSLRTKAAYEGKEHELNPTSLNSRIAAYRDKDQEQRVLDEVGRWFPEWDKNQKAYVRQVSDDELYDFLTAGIPSLEFYGTVNGSSAFLSQRVIPQPKVQVGISVESDLLNITVLSKDISLKELLSVYDSYTKKKRYYRLKSGDFVDLTENERFRELDEFLRQMELSPKELLHGKTQIPIYRALYLNKMLEGHEELVASRDRTYRALIRNFKTVQEAEYEVPAVLDGVLRSYQVYGYKWLRTLQGAGFGGILADEMGLGKTVQMIALFESDRLSGEFPLPSLVVCPASLLYNWQEEIRRFAPELRSTVIAGTQGVRKKLLASPDAADVFITSYDLLKRDIVLYEKLEFQNCVLDEAQYIKNASAAASKSARLIRAKHRFALTGTPIENRLAELWSIFDYLMPGFLYGRSEFEKRYELPITKQHDPEATEKLKAMTAPFILRRKKTDVLKDLPEKLEECRYARISGEQQKLYDAQVVRMKGMLKKEELQGEEKIKMFAELMRIRQICCDPSLLFENYKGESAKREACLELIESAMEGGHRMLVFSQFVSMLELLEEDLQARKIPYFKITGATPKEKRISMVREFNEGDVPLFLISLKAGGTGLNLTGADVVIHYDPWWNLAVQNQATDRAHRIGQTKQVTVYKLILKDTIEERIQELQDLKKDLAEAILEGSRESIMSLTPEELMKLLS